MLFLAGTFSLLLLPLVGMHTFLIMEGKTTNEHINHRGRASRRSCYDSFRTTLCGPHLPSRIFAALRFDIHHPLYGDVAAQHAQRRADADAITEMADKHISHISLKAADSDSMTNDMDFDGKAVHDATLMITSLASKTLAMTSSRR